MHRRLTSLLASAAILAAACQPASQISSAPSAPASPTPAAATSAAPTLAPTPIDYDELLYAASYQPSTGTPGGKVVLSSWGPAVNQLNPWYSNAFGTYEVLAATMRTLLRVTGDGHYQPDLAAEPITYADSVVQTPAGPGGFTVHVTLKPGPQTGRTACRSPSTTSSTPGSGCNDPAQVGMTPAGLRGGRPDRRRADGLVGRHPLQGGLRRLARARRRRTHPARALHEDDPDQGLRRRSRYPVTPALARRPDDRSVPVRHRDTPIRSSSPATTTGRPGRQPAPVAPASTPSRSSTTRTTRRARSPRS